MLRNSGPYGPNDVPINMGMPVNMTQMSNPVDLGNNLGNLVKIPQAPQSTSPAYDVPDYSSFGHPPLNMGHPMSPFGNYHHLNFQTNYGHPNPNLPHDNTSSNIQNNMLPMSLNIQSDHGPSLMNYHNFESKKLDVNNTHYRESLSRKIPINIPQVPTKAFQKHLGMDANYSQYNPVQENPMYTHDLSKMPEKSLIDSSRRKSLENTVKLIENILINSTPKDKLKNLNTESFSLLTNTNADRRKSHKSDKDSNIATQSASQDLSHRTVTKYDPNVTESQKTNIEINEMKSDVHDLSINLTRKMDSPTKILESKTKYEDTNVENEISSKLNDATLINLSKTNNTASSLNAVEKVTEIQSEIRCKPLRRSLINNNRTVLDDKRKEFNDETDSEKEDPIAEVNIKIEIEEEVGVKIKVEPLECTNSETMPFLRDSSATHRDDVEADAVIIEENNVIEATEAAKKGTNPKTYYECSHCNLLFKHPKRFLIHTKWHTFGLTSETRYRMEKEKELRKSMKREARIIERLNAKEVKDGAEGDTHPCKDCDKVFAVKSSLKNHRQKYHPTRVRECKICKASVIGWMALRAHVAAHAAGAGAGAGGGAGAGAGGGGYACADCPKRFKYAHSLAKHRDTHLEKTHACEQCEKKFGSQALLKMHMKCHERTARGATFRCTYCGKGFFESYNLQVHERTHRNERPFTCEICKTSFGTNSSLKRHLKVSHSSSKPFACPTCHRSFASATTRARHTARVHGDSSAFPYKCSLCPRQYSASKELHKHIGKAHREERDRGEVG